MSNDPLAYFWFLSSLLGIAIGVRGIRRSRRRRFLAEQLPESDPERAPMLDAARSHIRREVIRLGIQIVALVIGVGAVLDIEAVLRLVAPALVFGVQWGTVANSWLDERALERQASSYSAIRVQTAQELMGAAVDAEMKGEGE